MNYIFQCLIIAGSIVSTLFAQTAQVRIIVDPQSTARYDSLRVFIAGNRNELGMWDPRDVELHHKDSVWIFKGDFLRNSKLEFKITAGDWNREAVYSAGIVPDNDTLTVVRDTTIILHPLMWKDQMQLSRSEKQIRGTVEYYRGMTGPGLRSKRDIIIWLPPSYDSLAKKRYPVLYMHDGQNIFDPSTSFGGYDWRVDEVADSLITLGKLNEIIIVGVYNTPDRLSEYSDSPLGEKYMQFIVKTLKPYIDSTYRTKKGSKNTAMMGSSMGGLISLIMAWKYPSVFGSAACLSPSFWYDDEKTLQNIRSDRRGKRAIRIYLDCGDKEKELLPGYRQMVTILKKKGYRKGVDLDYHIEKNGIHNERSWARRVWKPLLFMFGKN